MMIASTQLPNIKTCNNCHAASTTCTRDSVAVAGTPKCNRCFQLQLACRYTHPYGMTALADRCLGPNNPLRQFYQRRIAPAPEPHTEADLVSPPQTPSTKMSSIEDIRAKYRRGSLSLSDASPSSNQAAWTSPLPVSRPGPIVEEKISSWVSSVSSPESHYTISTPLAPGSYYTAPSLIAPAQINELIGLYNQHGSTTTEQNSYTQIPPHISRTPAQRLLELQWILVPDALQSSMFPLDDSSLRLKIDSTTRHAQTLTAIMGHLEQRPSHSPSLEEEDRQSWTCAITTSIFMACYLCLLNAYDDILSTLKYRGAGYLLSITTTTKFQIPTAIQQLPEMIKRLQNYTQGPTTQSSSKQPEHTRSASVPDLDASQRWMGAESPRKQAFEMDAFGYKGLYRNFDLVSPGFPSGSVGRNLPMVQVTGHFVEEINGRHQKVMKSFGEVGRLYDR